MQHCTRTCAHFQLVSAVKLLFRTILFLLCTQLQAQEVSSHQLVVAADENQDPGRHQTRSVPVGDTPSNGLINVNSASVLELATALPGIGPGKAQNIVDWRNANGPFQYLEQLLEVSGIGAKTLERISPYIHLGDGSETVSDNSIPKQEPEHQWVLLDIVKRANDDAAQVQERVLLGM